MTAEADGTELSMHANLDVHRWNCMCILVVQADLSVFNQVRLDIQVPEVLEGAGVRRSHHGSHTERSGMLNEHFRRALQHNVRAQMLKHA